MKVVITYRDVRVFQAEVDVPSLKSIDEEFINSDGMEVIRQEIDGHLEMISKEIM